MYLLPKEKYPLAAQRLREVTINNMFARSVLERHVDGLVYADNPDSPAAFYVIHPYGMALLYGKVSDVFLQPQLRNHLLGIDGKRVGNEFLQVFPSTLEHRIDDTLGTKLCASGIETKPAVPDVRVIKHQRINFKFRPNKFARLLAGINLNHCDFIKVDSDLFNQTKGSVVPHKFWNNAADFITHAVGFAINYRGKPAAIAFASFIHDHMLELGIETQPQFQQKGLATLVSAKLISYCLENELEPVWACKKGNAGSYNLALKLGFEATTYLPYYELLL